METKNFNYFTIGSNLCAPAVTNSGSRLTMNNAIRKFDSWCVRLTLALLFAGTFMGGYGFMALMAQLLR